MRPESDALLRALLEHHANVCVPDNGRFPPREDCVIAYGTLCEEAGTGHILRIIGTFLLEVAQWCAACGHPPINALAVNATTRIPGENYAAAPGCSNHNWEAEVEEVIAYRNYPQADQV
jgi:hypothetical protein